MSSQVDFTKRPASTQDAVTADRGDRNQTQESDIMEHIA